MLSLNERIRYGMLSLTELSDVIKKNLTTAESLGITVRTYFNRNKIFTGQLKRNGSVIFEKLYMDNFQHMRIARFHGDIDFVMNNIIEDEKRLRQIEEKNAKAEAEKAQRLAEQQEADGLKKMKWVQGKGFVE